MLNMERDDSESKDRQDLKEQLAIKEEEI